MPVFQRTKTHGCKILLLFAVSGFLGYIVQ